MFATRNGGIFAKFNTTQLAFTCSVLTIKAEQGVKSVYTLLLTLNIFCTLF